MLPTHPSAHLADSTLDFLEPANNQREYSLRASLTSRLGFSFLTLQPESTYKNTCYRVILRTKFILEIRNKKKKKFMASSILKKKINLLITINWSLLPLKKKKIRMGSFIHADM